MTHRFVKPALVALATVAVATTGLVACGDSSKLRDRSAEVQVSMTLRDDGVEVRDVDCYADAHCTITLTSGKRVVVSVERFEDGSVRLAPADRP